MQVLQFRIFALAVICSTAILSGCGSSKPAALTDDTLVNAVRGLDAAALQREAPVQAVCTWLKAAAADPQRYGLNGFAVGDSMIAMAFYQESGLAILNGEAAKLMGADWNDTSPVSSFMAKEFLEVTTSLTESIDKSTRVANFSNIQEDRARLQVLQESCSIIFGEDVYSLVSDGTSTQASPSTSRDEVWPKATTFCATFRNAISGAMVTVATGTSAISCANAKVIAMSYSLDESSDQSALLDNGRGMVNLSVHTCTNGSDSSFTLLTSATLDSSLDCSVVTFSDNEAYVFVSHS